MILNHLRVHSAGVECFRRLGRAAVVLVLFGATGDEYAGANAAIRSKRESVLVISKSVFGFLERG